jgi:hypothetical protein
VLVTLVEDPSIVILSPRHPPRHHPSTIRVDYRKQRGPAAERTTKGIALDIATDDGAKAAVHKLRLRFGTRVVDLVLGQRMGGEISVPRSVTRVVVM